MLSHFLQRAGIATTGISLIREHTEAVRPPRALWTSFPLGRPFGAADAPDFQRDVLRSALRLLETAQEPTIEDYPYDAPSDAPAGVWACPVALPQPDASDLERALRTEVDLLTPWYEETRRRRGRTTVGMSGASPEELDAIVAFVIACAEGAGFAGIPPAAEGPNWIHAMPILLRYVVEDLRAFYQEAVASRPGPDAPSHHALHSWIFEQTALGQALIQIGRRIADAGEPRLVPMRGFIIPEGFWESGVTWGTPPDGENPVNFIRRAQSYLIGEEA